MTEKSAAENPPPVVSDKPAVNILKLQSRYKDAAGVGKRGQDKRLSFADDHGDILTEDHFIDHLHYSPSSMSGIPDGPRGCCVVS